MKQLSPLIIVLFLLGCASQPEPKKNFFNTQVNKAGWRVFSFSVPIPDPRGKKDRNKGERGKGHDRGAQGKGLRSPRSNRQMKGVSNERFNQIVEAKFEQQLTRYSACSQGYKELDRYFGAAYLTVKGRCLVKPK